MLLLVGFLAMSFSAPSFAMVIAGGDMMMQTLQCESVDAGNDQSVYSLHFSEGGYAFHIQGELTTHASRGVKAKTQSFFLKSTEKGGYVDALTDGNQFSMQFQSVPLVGQPGKALLKLQSSNGPSYLKFLCYRLIQNY